MKAKLSLVIIAVVLCLYACKKGDKNAGIAKTTPVLQSRLDTTFILTPISASIIGKWAETKERIQQQNKGVPKIGDTTYNNSDFDATDYYQFNPDSTVVQSQSGIYTVNGIGVASTGAGNPVISNTPYNFSVRHIDNHIKLCDTDPAECKFGPLF